MAHIISSRNLFIDTSADLNGSQGDNITLQLGADSIHAASGQQIKLTLSYFSMYRNWYSININNSKVRLTTDANATELVIPSLNYRTYGDIVTAFAEQVRAQALADAVAQGSTAGSATVVDLFPAPTILVNTTSDRIMSFTILFDQPHTLTTFRLQSFAAVGESYEVLGGNRILDPASAVSSYTCTISSATELTVTGLYPMQRSTDSHICLRCSLPNTNIETSSFSSATGPYASHTLTSNILAMIPCDIEYTSFTSSTDGEFFLDLTTQIMSAIRLFLTDHKNRPLGRIAGSGSQTAAGTGTAQSTLGNLSFRAIVRVDVIQVTIPRTLHTKLPPQTVPPRLAGPILNNLDTE